MLKKAAITCLICLPFCPFAASADSSGKFSVFGPSAEREAFFADQRQERLDREDALRKEALEREKLATKERIAANQAKANKEAATKQIVPNHCWRVPTGRVTSISPVFPPTAGKPIAATARSEVPAYVIRCAPALGYFWPKPSRTDLNLTYDDGWSGRAIVRRPGLSIDLNFD